MQWLDARGGVSKLTHGPSSFLSDSTKSGANIIVEWSVFNANVLSHVVWESFGDVGFPTSEKVCGEKKKETLRKI